MNDNDPRLEHSRFCGNFTKDGITVEVQIYRMAVDADGWSLEVVDHTKASTVWDDIFPTDQDAYNTFHETVETEGIHTFLGHSVPRSPTPSHRGRRR